MNKIKIMIGRLIYNVIAKKLPTSFSPFKIGQKQMRAMCGRMIMAKCGRNVNIERDAVFSSNVELGDRSGLGIRSKISGTCRIGNDVMMGPDCVIYTRNHKFDDLSIPMLEQGFGEEKPVTIGNDVWIGGNVIILPGVQIGDHCIIGAGSVVTKNVPDMAIVAGNPAVIKKYRVPRE